MWWAVRELGLEPSDLGVWGESFRWWWLVGGGMQTREKGVGKWSIRNVGCG